jgi:hypothetical protein
MSIFPNLIAETTVQVNDRLRLDASKSFASKDEAAITAVEIEPEAAAGFISVFSTKQNDWFLDWEYATDGAKAITVRITTDGAPVSRAFTVNAITSANDKLFSNDADLQIHEVNILKWLPDGKNSFKYLHRRAQDLIIAWLDEQGFVNVFDTKFDKNDILDIEEVRQWSTFMVLKLIFESISNSVDDVFDQKARKYHSEELIHKKRAVLRIDIDGDGVVDSFEDINISSSRVFRR